MKKYVVALCVGLICVLPSIGEAATVKIYSTTGDGRASTAPYPGSWATQHAATSSPYVAYAYDIDQVTSQAFNSSTGYLSMQRGFFAFDTSVIPGPALLTGADLNIYLTEVHDQFNDQYSTLSVYEGLQASTTALLSADVDNCGNAITNPTSGASDVDISSLSTNEYLPFALNTNGLEWISPTGYTKLCIREGHDAANAEPVNNTNSWKTSGVLFAMTEMAGTDKDPYLEVTYALPPLPPEQLYTEGTTTPLDVADTTPELSAVFTASEASIATHYQVQVSASSTSWTSPVWDSGKTAMASTSVGARIPDISFAGTPLALDGSTYFWRIKLWSSDGMEGYWSGTHYFVME